MNARYYFLFFVGTLPIVLCSVYLLACVLTAAAWTFVDACMYGHGDDDDDDDSISVPPLFTTNVSGINH